MEGARAVDFSDWYMAEHARLVTTLASITGDHDIACEATDEAFVRAYERWSRVSAMDSPAGWVYRTGLNVARRRLRRRNFERRAATGPVSVDGPTGELWMVVATLPPRQREAVVLRHVGQMTEAEIGAAMGIRRGTVSSTLRDAYRKLAPSLADAPIETKGTTP